MDSRSRKKKLGIEGSNHVGNNRVLDHTVHCKRQKFLFQKPENICISVYGLQSNMLWNYPSKHKAIIVVPRFSVDQVKTRVVSGRRYLHMDVGEFQHC